METKSWKRGARGAPPDIPHHTRAIPKAPHSDFAAISQLYGGVGFVGLHRLLWRSVRLVLLWRARHSQGPSWEFRGDFAAACGHQLCQSAQALIAQWHAYGPLEFPRD